MSITFRHTILFCAIAVVAAACTQESPLDASSTVVEIAIRDNQFLPAEITIPAGSTVRWTNDDPICLCGDYHAVQSGTPAAPTDDFNFMFMEMDATGQYTFDTVGTFPYYCATHGETGIVTVR